MNFKSLVNGITQSLNWHKERCHTFASMVIGLIDQKNVQHHAFSKSLGTQATVKSKLERIRRFFKGQAPLCLIGYETIRAEAQNDVIAFCEQWNIPMITSANAKGILKESHPLNLGAVSPYMAGILGSETVLDDLFASKDLIVTVSYQYVDDIYPSMWNRGTLKKLIHISAFFPTPLEPQYKPDVSCLGKIQESFHLLKQFVAEPKSIPNTNVYKNRIKVIYNEKTADKNLSIFHLIKTINDNLQEGIFVTDVGFFKHYAILFAQPQTAGQFITDAGLSSFGTGLGAAAAAQIAHPDKTIFLLCGDGGFQASSCDLSTLVQQQLPLISSSR